MSTFTEKLNLATNEDKQVNPLYVQEIKKTIPKVTDNKAYLETDEIIYPEIKTDGVFRCHYIKDDDGIDYNFLMQLECKLDTDFNDIKERAKVLLQVCCYLKQIHDEVLGYNGDWKSNAIPKVVVVGSKINCFALSSSILIDNYSKYYINGFKSASTAHLQSENSQILTNIEHNDELNNNIFVYEISDKNSIKNLCSNLVKLGKGLKLTDDLNEQTISRAFDFFDMYVLDSKQSNKLSSREKVDLFIGTFFNEEFEETKTNRYTNSPDKLKIHGIEIKINPDKYNSFKIMFNMREYSKMEQKEITAITDRLIEDTDRRRKGDFYTPTIWVDEAHKLLDKNLGDNWRDEYMIWDCAWGTGNLTRDYKFADLYCSTLQEEDLNIGYRYNKNAVKFQYDFLNDDVLAFEQVEKFCKMGQFDTANAILFNTKLYKMAPGLINGLLGINGKEKKSLLFLINPPYATSGVIGTGAKSGTSDSNIKDTMKDNKISGSDQLWIQFIYRIYTIKKLFNADIKIGAFTPSKILSLVKGKEVNNILINEFGYYEGYGICAANFADVKPNWSISFTLWGSGNIQYTKLHIMEMYGDNVKTIQDKELRVVLGEDRAIEWAKKSTKAIKTETLPRFTSAINYNINSYYDRNIEALAVFCCDLGIVETNMQRVTILPSRINANWTFWDITKDNFDKAISFFTARKLVSPDWINSKDEYMVPNIEHLLYKQWQSDCIVHSIFNTASNQSSLRNIGNNKCNIQNQFFWMSYKEIANLAGGKYSKDDINTAIEDDIEDFGKERFVYKKLQEVTLSPDAQAVLDMATELVQSSFKYRKQFNIEHPEYHINTWDAGWYQIKGLLKEYNPEGLKQFNNLYKQLEDRMRHLVYELGFLYK